jgi:hypothetical protein
MASSDGWYLIGPLIAVALVGLLAAFMRWSFDRDADPLRELYAEGLGIFGERDDYGLLFPAALTEDLDVAQDVRGMLAGAGIRATQVVRPDGRIVVLVFAEEVEEARRLVGGSPAV